MIIKCCNCGVEFNRVPFEVKKSKNHYCSKCRNSRLRRKPKYRLTKLSKNDVASARQLAKELFCAMVEIDGEVRAVASLLRGNTITKDGTNLNIQLGVIK